jgi:transposase
LLLKSKEDQQAAVKKALTGLCATRGPFVPEMSLCGAPCKLTFLCEMRTPVDFCKPLTREEEIERFAKASKRRSMETEQKLAAKRHMLELMQAGHGFQEAATLAGVQTSRSTAYRWWQAYRTRGAMALQDGRHGHPAKVRPAVLHWLESRCQAASQVPSSQLQKELQEQCGVRISISHLNALRATHGWRSAAAQGEKKSRIG